MLHLGDSGLPGTKASSPPPPPLRPSSGTRPANATGDTNCEASGPIARLAGMASKTILAATPTARSKVPKTTLADNPPGGPTEPTESCCTHRYRVPAFFHRERIGAKISQGRHAEGHVQRPNQSFCCPPRGLGTHHSLGSDMRPEAQQPELLLGSRCMCMGAQIHVQTVSPLPTCHLPSVPGEPRAGMTGPRGGLGEACLCTELGGKSRNLSSRTGARFCGHGFLGPQRSPTWRGVAEAGGRGRSRARQVCPHTGCL